MGARVGFWLTIVATAALYAAIIGWSAPYISAQAGGAAIFDLRPMGYSFEEAVAFLQGLNPDGARFYRAVQLRLDLFYPLLIAVTTGWALLWLMPPWRGRTFVVAAPVLAMVFDYAENFFIHHMLLAGPEGLSPELVSRASLSSRLKAIFSTLSFSLLLIVVAFWAYRRFWQTARKGIAARD